MKKSILSIILVTVILFASTTCFLARTAFANIQIITPEENAGPNNNQTKNSSILINHFNSDFQLPNGCYIAANYEELNRLEDIFKLDLSRTFERTDEFHNDEFVYFIQVYTPQPSSDIKDQYPVSFTIDNLNASFDYDKSDSVCATVVYPSRVAIAAVPADLLSAQGDISDNLYVNNDGTTWNRF